ncbi:predicted protein [Phaeodactylum tricornutum CCAP 1055/1]|jgi:hypothetical protein|uniref:RRM domain-containing protein n=2 Tax=Phaeodactylum tricornutum TaxID=2850 RepID=B7FQF2_PHATC|nr:predicted protein [Phaeodactylum tricornutum CCAP 1055/1]EEC51323.1 predicted protein [Phaeodactylum tricornutum CCAP 1055/1]|eukprot:XP_002176860.1 predicted protein [Phaeodactylum tricornutum CCAP 1055/1]
MVQIRVLVLAASLSLVSAWVPSFRRSLAPSSTTARRMAIDYNDPIVGEEFNKVQPMAFEDVEQELREKGIPVPPTMNEMEIKLMLVEMRLRLSGKLAGQTEKKRPAKFSSKFEEAMWTKPMFKEFYDELKQKGDHNAQNVVAEYLNDKTLALQRYGKDYKAVIRRAEAALTAAPPVNSPTLKFSGFPANMGESGCKMTLEALGTIVGFECHVSEDLPILTGTVTFDDIESAKKAVAQYNGMDMGMGTKLEIASV